MAIKGLAKTSTYPYVLIDDPCRGPKGEPVEGSTIFQIGSLDGYQKARVKDLQSESKLQQLDAEKAGTADSADFQINIKMMMYSAAYEACRLGLHGWSNFSADIDGVETKVEFKTVEEIIGRRKYQVVDGAALSFLDPDSALELMNEIMEHSSVSKEQEGNSVAVSSAKNSSPSASVGVATPQGSASGAATPAPTIIPAG